jgi:RNA polymerase sigma factor (sigma-70 family)
MAERLTELTADDRTRAEAVLEQHARFIEAVATRYAATYDLVPDIVQEVGIRVCQNLHGFRAEAQISTWLFAVTRNTAISMLRRESRVANGREQIAAKTVDDIVDVEADLIDRDEHAYRRRLLARGIHEACTPRQREALRHLTQPEGVSFSRDEKDKANLFRARQRLKRWVANLQDDDE